MVYMNSYGESKNNGGTNVIACEVRDKYVSTS